MDLILYQTLIDRENPDFVEDHGPFKCIKSNAWLGFGYYFWDTHLQLAHWWGETACDNKYIICQAKGKMDDTCWDLHGNGLHLLEFKKVCDRFIQAGITKKLLVPNVIEFFKQKGKFPYKAIRMLGTNSFGYNYNKEYRVYYNNKEYKKLANKPYLDLVPPVQICLIEKGALSLQNYKIVYPKHYSEL